MALGAGWMAMISLGYYFNCKEENILTSYCAASPLPPAMKRFSDAPQSREPRGFLSGQGT